MFMFFFLFLLWLLFNGRLTWDVLVTGAVFSAAVTAFGCRVCGWPTRLPRRALRLAGQLAVYAGCLLVEILKANLAMLRVILSPHCSGVRPQLFFFDTGLKSPLARTLLGNSITITPGTYTVGVYDGTLAVHAINPDFAAGTPDSDLNRRLRAMEAGQTEQPGQTEQEERK